MKFDEYIMKKWEDYQTIDIAASSLQNCFLNIAQYEDKHKILKYNDYIEKMRSEIHKIMKDCE